MVEHNLSNNNNNDRYKRGGDDVNGKSAYRENHNSLKIDQEKNNGIADSRKRLFIIAQGRTGSSLLGDLIDSHGDFLYFFEPLRAVERHLNISYFHLKTTDSFYGEYHRIVARFMGNLLNCRLAKEDDAILKLHDKGRFRHRSKILTQDSFCTKTEGGGKRCKPLTSEVMNRYCLDNPNTNIVIKELEFRIPKASIPRLMEKRFDVQVIHLVRDPRAFLLSMKRLGWLETPGSDHEDLFIKKRCLEVQNNIMSMALLYHQNHRSDGSVKTKRLKSRYIIFQYEDFARDYEGRNLGRVLSAFLDLDFMNTTRRFYTAKFTQKTISHGDPFSTGQRNIKASLEAWHNPKHWEYVKKVEMTCKNLMMLLDYETAYQKKL